MCVHVLQQSNSNYTFCGMKQLLLSKVKSGCTHSVLCWCSVNAYFTAQKTRSYKAFVSNYAIPCLLDLKHFRRNLCDSLPCAVTNRNLLTQLAVTSYDLTSSLTEM